MNLALHVAALAAFAASCASLPASGSGERLFYEMQVTAPGTRSQGIRGRLFDDEGHSIVTNAYGEVVPENTFPAASAGAELVSSPGVFLHRAQLHLWDVSGMIPQVMLATPHLNDPAVQGPTSFRLFVRGVCTPQEVWRGELLDSHGAAIGQSDAPLDTPMSRFRYRSGPQQAGWFPESWPESASVAGAWPCSPR
jgi:hypothetical protein